MVVVAVPAPTLASPRRWDRCPARSDSAASSGRARGQRLQWRRAGVVVHSGVGTAGVACGGVPSRSSPRSFFGRYRWSASSPMALLQVFRYLGESARVARSPSQPMPPHACVTPSWAAATDHKADLGRRPRCPARLDGRTAGIVREQSEAVSTRAGHRQRLRDRFQNSGLEGFADYEIVELLLTLAIPRSDVKQPAKELIRRFGDLRGILDAPSADLRTVPGIGKVAPVALKIVKAAATLYLQQESEAGEFLADPSRLEYFWRMRLGSAPTVLGHPSRLQYRPASVQSRGVSRGTTTCASAHYVPPCIWVTLAGERGVESLRAPTTRALHATGESRLSVSQNDEGGS